MIGDLGAAVGLLFLNGGLLLFVGFFLLSVAALAGFGWGRRSAFREVDEGRIEVQRAVHASLPNQREGEL